MRKRTNRLILPLLSFLSFSVPAISQSSSLSGVKAQLDLMFAGLDKTKVSTGFLWDTAINMVERQEYNGTSLTDSNYVSLSVMEDLLSSINSASVGADTIGVQAALARLQRNSSSSVHMVGILFQPYNYIVENALTDNLIEYSNDLVSDSYIGGVWQNPYSEDVLFGYAIGEESAVSLTAYFSFTNIDSLSTRSFQSIQFDPGDGGGFRNVSFGSVIMVNYSEDGFHTTRLKGFYGGQEYKSHSYIYVFDSNTPQHSGETPILDTAKITIHANYGDQIYTAKVTYRTPLCFNNPLIISEGFDPWRLKDSACGFFEGFSKWRNIIEEGPNNVDAYSYFNSHNVFYVDWYDCGADIRANAEVLKEVIKWVNLNKTSGNKNIVLGQSMGGLIARYALRDMELKHEAHDTKLFISHDVPHKGANISPGLMFSYWDIIDVCNHSLVTRLLSGQTSLFEELASIGNYMSVRQMLPYFVNSAWNYDNSYYNLFQSTINDIGFPKGDSGFPIENVAIINGGRSGEGSLSLHSPGDYLLDINITSSADILLGGLISLIYSYSKNASYALIPGKTTLRYDLEAFPFLSNGNLVHRMTISYTKKFLWCLSKTFVIKDAPHYAPSYGVAFDDVSASYYDMGSVKEYKDVLDSVITSWLPDSSISFDLSKRIAFVPTASAFASNDFYKDFRNNHPAPIISTPFTSYIMPDTTTYHTSFYRGIQYWLEQVEGMSIDGPLMPQAGDVYSMPSEYTSSFLWSTSNNSVASINASGIITETGCGLVDIIARRDSITYVVSKRKTVLAGLPRMALTSNHSGTQYTVRAECIDDGVEDFLSRTHLTDSIMRKWYLEVGGVKIDSTFNYEDTASFNVAESVNIAYVTLILSYKGRTSFSAHEKIKEKRNYLWNIADIIRFEDETVYLRNGLPWITDTDDPPYFKLRKNENDTIAWPAKLKATAEYFVKRTSGPLAIVDNCAVWDLFTDSDVVGYINRAYRSGLTEELIIDVYSDTVESDANLVQTIVIPIHPHITPIPLEM